MRASEYFEEVREAALEQRRLEALLARSGDDGLRAQGYEARGARSPGDPMRSVDARLDAEGPLRARAETASGLVAEATTALYGTRGRGGLLGALVERGVRVPGRHVDALYSRYVLARSWKETAEVVGGSERWAQELAARALRCADESGLASLLGR